MKSQLMHDVYMTYRLNLKPIMILRSDGVNSGAHDLDLIGSR
jgi:hypothetical protein